MSITVHYFVMKEKKRKGQIGIANEPLSTVNPLISPSPPGGIFISSPFERGVIETGGLFNLAKTMVSIFHKIQSGKAQVQDVEGHAAEDQKQFRTSRFLPHEVLQSCD